MCEGCNLGNCPDNDWCENRKCFLKKVLYIVMLVRKIAKGGLSKIKPYEFPMFIKRYEEDKLLDCLAENEKRGLVYHREGINGDYDDFDNVGQLMEFIKTGSIKFNDLRR